MKATEGRQLAKLHLGRALAAGLDKMHMRGNPLFYPSSFSSLSLKAERKREARTGLGEGKSLFPATSMSGTKGETRRQKEYYT